MADVQVRIGSPKLDNTHGTHRASAVNSLQLPLGDDREALARSLWLATNTGYGNALDNYLRVKTEAQVRAKEEDTSPDFSQQVPANAHRRRGSAHRHRPCGVGAAGEGTVRIFRDYPDVYQNMVILTVENETDYFVSSEGSQIVAPHLLGAPGGRRRHARRRWHGSLPRSDLRSRNRRRPSQSGRPRSRHARSRARVLKRCAKLRSPNPSTAPRFSPAAPPRSSSTKCSAIASRASASAATRRARPSPRTSAKRSSPTFLSVADDPTVTTFGNTWLSGSYQYDDEGQKAERVDLIQDGVLKTFLMSRLPIASFGASNGHGRAETGHVPTGRQGNLIVTSTKSVSDAELRKQLIEEAKKQGKPYGLYFEDISSGFAVTQRSSPQAFQVIPLVVWRVYVDGRPDELVRGVSIVGTPLAAMKSILATGDKSEVFNGECGAESGTIPVSAVAPAMLLSEIETQRQPQGTARPPILPIPGADSQRPTTKEAQ